MSYRTLSACVRDLEQAGQLVRIEEEVNPHLEAAAIHRRVYRAGGPALFFARVRGTPFPMVSNIFGTLDRMRFLFRGTIDSVRKLIELRSDPTTLRHRPWRYWNVPLLAWRMRPRFTRSGPVLANTTTLSQLPQLKCWPLDGGPFVTLPAVYTEHPDAPGWRRSNLGMYRVQFAGNDYLPSRECGMHYQIHRGIGVHHAAALARGEPLPVSIAVGGPPALTVAAVMPLPEGMPEIAFAGVLGGRRVRMCGLVPADADFVISGFIDPTRTKPEGPFGDHLGYYSLQHDFPVVTVTGVFHRNGAIWPFTVVGRPPQEDTSFGAFIHELTGPVIPTVIPGVHAVNAVDATGVHPLLLAVGSERYVPYAERRRPQELLTLANAILGQGQLSLAKYLFIAAKEDAPSLDIHDIPAFLRHVLERFDPEVDLHFQTRTTIDTLDYSAGRGLNAGSKLVVAAAGPKRRELATAVPHELRLPDGFSDPRIVMPGVLAVGGPQFQDSDSVDCHPVIAQLCIQLECRGLESVPLVTVVDDSEFVSRNLNNWLWVTFTRSDPANDVSGAGDFINRKHWGCRGPVIIDARLKPYMPPPLEEDPAVLKRIDRFFARGGPLARVET